jgi:hypothetical protein
MAKQILNEQFHRMQKLAGILKENQTSPELTEEELSYLDDVLQEFLEEKIYQHPTLLEDDSEDFETTKEARVIYALIGMLEEMSSYY